MQSIGAKERFAGTAGIPASGANVAKQGNEGCAPGMGRNNGTVTEPNTKHVSVSEQHCTRLRAGRARNGVRAVALVEMAKGLLVLTAGCALLSLVHKDAQAFAERLVAHLHLNPAGRYPRVFEQLAAQITDARLWILAAAALCYSAVRLAEAYGLWFERRWAEWFGAATGCIYIPFELFGLWERVTTMRVAALAVNIVVVAYLGYVLNAGRYSIQSGAEP